MPCATKLPFLVGPTASVYALPAESVIVLTVEVPSPQPTMTTLRSPAFCALVSVVATDDDGVCGQVNALCTNVGVDGGGGAAWVVAVAVFEYVPRLFVASLARTR